MDLSKKNNNYIGSKIKSLRKNRGLTLEELGKKSNLSKTYISQIENKDQTNPSVSVLKKITDAFNVPLMSLFDSNFEKKKVLEEENLKNEYITNKKDKEVIVIKSNERKILSYAHADWRIELLSPDLNRKIELILTVAPPGTTSGPEKFNHEGEECGIILEGSVVFKVNGNDYLLKEGDSIYFNSTLEHSWRVVGDKTLKKIWAITPPSF